VSCIENTAAIIGVLHAQVAQAITNPSHFPIANPLTGSNRVSALGINDLERTENLLQGMKFTYQETADECGGRKGKKATAQDPPD
jgi:hypothetical protein